MVDEKALSTNALDHALAFRENSAQLFSDAIGQVKVLARTSDAIYPPIGFPTWRNRCSESTIRLQPDSDFDGQLTFAEAAATVVLLNEVSALAQASGRTDEMSDKLHAVLQLPENGWQSDTIDGLADFGNMLGWAARIRERIISGEGAPNGKTLGDAAKRSWWNKFEKPVRQDGLKLGENTAQAIIKTIVALAERDIPNNPEGAKTPDQIAARIASKKHGAELAAQLYLESWRLAAKILPDTIQTRINVKSPARPQLGG
jgi:hypothetical protein